MELHARPPVLAALDGGQWVSGDMLAARTGVTRAAIWKQINHLRAAGLAVEAQSGRGYRLRRPVRLLDAAAIAAAADAGEVEVDVLWEVVSTSTLLLQHAAPMPCCRAVLAECQRGGRGRRGRQWHSPCAAHIYLSMAWDLPTAPANFSAWPLAAGVAVAEALEGATGAALQLKWPNDLVWQGRKLAGLLLESRWEHNGGCRLVLGVGVNVDAAALAGVDQPVVSLEEIMGVLPDRNVVAGRLIAGLLDAFRSFQHDAAAWREPWWHRDLLRGQQVLISQEQAELRGTAVGVAADGALEVQTDEGCRQVRAGEVSVRMA
ncbi:MAG: biotin--[acetyl-CoA-carboxylase] ligase [Pseudomonadota bacterium]|nr:biotin--[acetyl-CoA-carboxylase] ligase [Pseudomonadota bacterium]